MIRLTNATVKYSMDWTLLIILEAQIDVVGIGPSEQHVIKGDGSKKMNNRNERWVRELQLRKTSLEAQPPLSFAACTQGENLNCFL